MVRTDGSTGKEGGRGREKKVIQVGGVKTRWMEERVIRLERHKGQ